MDDANSLYMASFDVENLFTNVPLRETVDICVSQLFRHCEFVCGISKKLFTTLLNHAVLNSFFIFDGKLYKQIDGIGMGLPLGPTFANLSCVNMRRFGWGSALPSSSLFSTEDM